MVIGKHIFVNKWLPGSGLLKILPAICFLWFAITMSLPVFAIDCDPETPSSFVDLTGSPDAIWQDEEFFSPEGQCCGVLPPQRCFTYTIELHEDADAIVIQLARQGTGGLISYFTDCFHYGTVPSDMNVSLCFDGPGPHEVTFCASGNAQYHATISSHTFEMDVSLNPFDEMCEDDGLIYMGGGQPSGGSYYLNGSLVFFFDPSSYGAGTYEVTYVYEDPQTGCVGSATQPLVVHPLPNLDFPPLTYCEGSSMIELSGATPEGGSYFGDYVSGGYFNAGVAGPGTFEIYYGYYSDEGCYNEVESSITINPRPPADAGPDQIIDQGETALLEAQDANTFMYSYNWLPSDMVDVENSWQTPTVPLNVSEIFTLEVTDNAGCYNTDYMTVFVSGGDFEILYAYADPDTICRGDSTQLFVLPTGGSGDFSYSWTSNPPGFDSGEAAPVVHPTQTTTYTVIVTDNNLVNTVEQSITVTVNPLPEVILDPFPGVCANETYMELTGGSPDGGFYSIPVWNFYNINSVNPSQLGEGYHLVEYTFTDPITGCTNTDHEYLEVFPRVKADFYAQQDFCETHVVNFINLSENATDYTWHIDNLDILVNPVDPFTYDFGEAFEPQTYEIFLEAVSDEGCVDTRIRNVKVVPPTIAQFNIIQDDTGCSPHTVNFDNTSSGPVSFYLWNFGDGSFSVSENPEHTFVNNSDQDTTFTVILTAVAENFMCVSSDSIEITVHPNVKAGFGFDPVSACHPYEIEIFNSAIGADIYSWDFGDGNTDNSDEETIFHTYENFTGDSLVFTIIQEVSNVQGCADSMHQEVVVYPYQEAGFDMDVNEGCAPLTVSFSDSSQGAVSGWYYDFGDGGSSSQASPQHTFENTTDTPITYEVMQVTDNGFFCPDTTYQQVTVYPEFEADFTFSPTEGCAPHQITFNNTSTGYTTGYHWDMGDGTTYDHDDASFTHTYENPGPDPVTYDIVLTATNGFCDRTKVRSITIFPEVTAFFEPDPLVGCQPMEVGFLNQSTNATTFMWEFGDGGSSVEEHPEHTFQNQNYDTPQTYTVSLLTWSDHLCMDYYETEITLNPAIKADFAIEEPEGCTPFELNIENVSKGVTVYSWRIDGMEFSSTDEQYITHTLTNNTNEPLEYQLLLLVENDYGCTDELEKTITVFPEVTAAFASETEGCHPLQIEFNNTSNNAHYFDWQFGEDGSSIEAFPTYTFYNQSHTESIQKTVTLLASSIYGCQDQTDTLITVFPRPDPSFLVENSPGCSPHEINIQNQTIGAMDFFWDFGDGSEIDNSDEDVITHTYYLPPDEPMQTFEISLDVISDLGCEASLTQEATIYPDIVADFTANHLAGCHPFTVDFTNLSQGATAYTSYEWDYGDGHTSSSDEEIHSHTFHNYSNTEAVTYTVELVAHNENACSDTTEIEITVWPAPKTLFTVDNPTGCSPHHIEIENQSVGAEDFWWDFDDGNTSDTDESSFNYTFEHPPEPDPALFVITLETGNEWGCASVYEQTVTVFPEVTASFDSETEGCHPLNVNFENTSQGATYTEWNFGDGNHSQAFNPSHIYFNYSYTETADFLVYLHSENDFGCMATHQDTITVFPLPLSNFDLSETSGCSPFEPTLYNISEGSTTHLWDFGNGTSDSDETEFIHTWINQTDNPLSYQLMLEAGNEYGCTDLSMQVINVFPEVTADFTTADDIFEGCSPFTVQFENLSQLANHYHWDFSTGHTTTGTNPLHIFSNDSIYPVDFPVQLVATSTYNCKDTIVKDIRAYPSPVANFMPVPLVNIYPETTFLLENLSKEGYWNYEWDFGDNNTYETTSAEPFNHTYEYDDLNNLTTRHFNIVLNVHNEHCYDYKTRQVTITSPVPDAEFISDTAGCTPFELQFFNTTEYAHSFHWYFGDGSESVMPNPVHIYTEPGEYEVMMIAWGDGGVDTTYQQITVLENPTAKFHLVNSLMEIPYEPLEVVNNSELADFYFWEFGDGNTSHEFEPVHYYEEAGIYTVSLTVNTNTTPSCSDIMIKTNEAIAQDACQVKFPNAFKPDPSGPSGGHYDHSNPVNEVFYPVYEGIEDYVLEIFNRWGELIFRSTDPEIGWDGYYRGKLAPMDVYVWKLSGRCSNGKELNKVGDVTLYR